MKKIKKLIIILCIVLMAILICILLIIKQSSYIVKESTENDKMGDVSLDFTKELGLVKNYSTFFSVEKMLTNYIQKIQSSDTKAIYSIMDANYISKNNITLENILKNVEEISKYASKVKIRKLYEEKNEENSIYYIYCILEKEHKGKEFYFILYKDEENLAYSVESISKETYEEKISNGEESIQEYKIERNDYNKSLYVNPTEEERVSKYFEDFIENALYYSGYTYNLLNEEYKKQCFSTLEDFNKYIDNKKELFLSYDLANLKKYEDFETDEQYAEYLAEVKIIKLQKYQIRMEDDYNKYICIDNQGNYYIFKATTPYNYSVILGNYAIPTDDFIKEYNKSTEAEKVVLNIKRFFMGIDDKNYGYSYSVLSTSFKNNKYPTKDDFITFAKQNFFEENEIEYISYKKENGLYIYNIKLTDATGSSLKEKELNIIVKLNSETNFEMSFGE